MKFLRALGATVIVAMAFVSRISIAAEGVTLLNTVDMQFLESITRDVVQSSRVAVGEKVGKIGPNTTGGTLIRPGGRDCYPAFWIRDYAMSIDSGFVTPEEQQFMLLLTAQHQQDSELKLPSGSLATPGSVPDHITFDGKSIFYPGTLDDFQGQGGPRWGKLPSLDDQFFFIRMAWLYVKQVGSPALLEETVNGKVLFQRLEDAYAMPPSSAVKGGLVQVDLENRGVTFGFVDSIIHTGELLMCSLLKWRAANEIAELAELSHRTEIAAQYRLRAKSLRDAIQSTFALDTGFLKASTGLSAQPDVWATAFAVYEGALDGAGTSAACRALAASYKAGAISWKGNIRHVPTSDDFSATTSWEKTDFAYNRYQNGAYWGTPTGWVCYAIGKVDPESARKLAAEYVAELREGDYRKGEAFGSPWECMHPQDNYRQNAVYMTTVTCPLVAFRRIDSETAQR